MVVFSYLNDYVYYIPSILSSYIPMIKDDIEKKKSLKYN